MGRNIGRFATIPRCENGKVDLCQQNTADSIGGIMPTRTGLAMQIPARNKNMSAAVASPGEVDFALFLAGKHCLERGLLFKLM
jgi:hypothetical protein